MLPVLAHVGGVPLEELLGPFVSALGAGLFVPLAAFVSRRRSARRGERKVR